MKYFALTILVLAFVLPASAKVTSTNKDTVQRLANELAKAFEAKDLGSLDAKKPYVGQVKIVIEHSLAGDDDKGRFVTRTFKTLKKAEQWLRSRATQDGPARETRKLQRCSNGVCRYNFSGGILHNHLYLKKFTYGSSGGRYYLKMIYLLDGD